jgi:hypothetical protein
MSDQPVPKPAPKLDAARRQAVVSAKGKARMIVRDMTGKAEQVVDPGETAAESKKNTPPVRRKPG